MVFKKWHPQLLKWLLSICVLILSIPAFAGYTELGIAGSYRKSFFADPSYDESASWTGSVDYLFATQSAIELSYTDGYSSQVLSFTDGSSRADESTTIYYQMISLDLVLSLLSPDNPVRPYVKVGGGYIMQKDLVYESGGTIVPIQGQYGTDTGLVPSLGAGIKINLTKDFALKAEAEGWASSPAAVYGHWDIIGNIGVSWLL